MIISLDTETTGVDFVHGARPYLVTTCDGDGCIRYWEWSVDPMTRRPDIPVGDLLDIIELVDAADLIYLQNAKFDWRALHHVGINLPWAKVRDTLVMGHLLASNHPHDLTSMCIEYLGVDIEPLEQSIKEITRICRAKVKEAGLPWLLATEGAPGMPSVKESSKRDEDKPWKNDMWLPRALHRAGHGGYIPEHWLTACAAYANADSEHTLYLGLEMERLIRERGLWAIYEHRLHLPRVACEMECCGITVIGQYTEATIQAYQEYDAEAGDHLRSIAMAGYGHDLQLAKGAALNDNMREFFYGSVRQSCPVCGYNRCVKHWNGEKANGDVCPKCAGRKKYTRQIPLEVISRDNLRLPVITGSKTGNATLDKSAMQEYLGTTDGTVYDFIKLLSDKRKRDTDLSYMESYQRFWVPVECYGTPDYYRIHPSLNPCATDHLRWSSNSPNLQNVGGQEDKCEGCEGRGCPACGGTGMSRVSVRNCFGPAPHREWWRMDYKSIERRIPAYESGEPRMVEVFERPNEPPYWGNLYCLTASILYPAEYAPRAGVEGLFRKEMPRLYKRAKFCDLAKQYGCGRKKYDLLSGIPGSFDLVDSEFPLLTALQARYLAAAESTGWVETLPDRRVDPTRGYPILASRTDDGRILTTTPFNYHVSGTACWAKNTALVRCSDQLAEWREDGFDAHMVLEVHDEILFDFPRGRNIHENLGRALVLKRLMEQSGEDLVPSMPLPVMVEYHVNSWADGTPVEESNVIITG